MKSYAYLGWMALLGAALVGGCGKSGDEASSNDPSKPGGKKLVVGFSQIGSESDWRKAETSSVKEEAQKRGITLKFDDAQQNQDGQVKAIRSFIAQKVDAILLAPKTEAGWEPVLKEAKAAHIPVILMDRGIAVSDDSLYTTLIGSDFIEEGRKAGQFVADALKGKGNIVEIEGHVGSAPAIDRKKGFHDVVDKQPGLKVILAQSGDFTLVGGKQVMEAFLKAQGKNINAVYCHNDDEALGAIQAITEAGLKPGKDMIVVSIDGTKKAVQALVDGKENYVVECNPLLGPQGFDAIQAVLAGKTLAKKIVSKETTFDQTSAAKALPDRQY